MVLVVTNIPVEYEEGYIVVSTIEEATSKLILADTLIYNRATDEDEADMADLFKLFKEAERVFYIRSEATMNYEIKVFVEGHNGEVVTDEFYLDSTQLLERLVSGDSITTEIALNDNLGAITEFSRMLDNNEEITRSYGDLIVDSTQRIAEDNRLRVLSEREIARASTAMIGKVLDRLEEVKKEQDSIKEDLKNRDSHVINVIKEAEITDGVYLNEYKGSDAPYSELSYRKYKSVNLIMIKDAERCNYLTTFVGGLQRYIQSTLKRNTRVIFIENAGVLAQKKYNESRDEDFVWITSSKETSFDKYEKRSVIFTDYFNTRRMKQLLDDNDYRITIIVDRTNYSINHILTTNFPEAVYYAVQSKSMMETIGAKKEKCITSNEQLDVKYKIRHKQGYEKYDDKIKRLQFYTAQYAKVYDELVHNCESLSEFNTIK